MGEFIQSIAALISGAGDPNIIARMLPDSSVWPHYLALAIRMYRLPVYLYYIGLGLFLVGLVLGILSYMAGRAGLMALVVRFSLAAIMWQLFVLTPGMNGCATQINGRDVSRLTPCVLQGDWQAVKSAGVEQEIAYPVVRPDGTIAIERIPIQLRPTYKVSFNPRPTTSGLPNDKPLPRLLKGTWANFNTLSNQALFRELGRQQKGIAEVKKSLQSTFVAIMVASGVTGGVSAVSNFFREATSVAGKTGLAALLGAGAVGFVAGGVEAVADATTRLIQGLGGALISAMMFGPVALLTIYHAMNTLSGAILYIALFSAPIIVGIGAMGGVSIYATFARVVILALLVPLLTGPIFGAAFRSVYGGLGEKAKQVEKLAYVANALVTSDDLTRAIRTAILADVAAKQLATTYECAKRADKDGTIKAEGLGLVCPERVEELFYSDASSYTARVNALMNKAKARNIEELIAERYATLPAPLLIRAGENPIEKAQAFVKAAATHFEGKEPDSFAQNRAFYESFMGFVKNWSPAYIWSWKAFIDSRARAIGLRLGGQSCRSFAPDDDANKYQKVLLVCLNDALTKGASDQLDPAKVRESFQKAKEVDQKIDIPSDWQKRTLTFDAQSGSYPQGWLTAESARMGRGASGLVPLEPEAPLYALDTGYVTLLIANSLPQALYDYSTSSFYTHLLSTLIALVLSLAIVGIAWGLLGQLVSVGGMVGAEVAGRVGAFLGSGTGALGANLAWGVPRTTRVDAMAGRLGEYEAVRRRGGGKSP